MARLSQDRTGEDQILLAGDRRRKPRSSDGWVPAARAELFSTEPEPSQSRAAKFIEPKLRLKLGSFSSRAELEPSFFRAEPEPSPSSLARYQPYTHILSPIFIYKTVLLHLQIRARNLHVVNPY